MKNERRSWFEIKASADKSGAEVYLYDEIGGWGISARDFIAEIKALTGKHIALHIHSPGGSVLDGHAIYNALLRHKGGLTVQIDGLAASMAGVVAMAGRPVRMAENAFLMIHNPWSISIGESEQMRKDADLLDKMRDGLVNIYAQKTGKEECDIEAMMDEETWLTATEAKEMGFIDEITDKLEMAASFDLKKFGKVPKSLAQVDSGNKVMEAPTADLTEKYETAAEQAKANFAALQLMTAERDTLKASMQSLSNEIAELKLDRDNAVSALATFQASEAEKVNAEAARLVAAAGHPALSVGGESSSGSNEGVALYDKFSKASPVEARALLNDPKTGPLIRAESARRHK